jgi:hypothetical protein
VAITTILCPSSAGDSRTTRVLPTATSARGTRSETSKVALKPGSSKHGSARRAHVASNCVNAYQSAASCSRYSPSS